MRRCHLFSGEASQKQSALSLFAPITWSLTWQQNSVLFHIASPCAKLNATWLTAHFWQHFADNLYLQNTSDAISSTPEITPSSPLSFAFMLNKQHQQSRIYLVKKGNDRWIAYCLHSRYRSYILLMPIYNI